MNSNSKRLIVIQGPTGVGKSAVAVALGVHYSAPILSADSRQIYRQMSIGTAVPTPAELASAPHHFIQECDIRTAVSAGEFEKMALERLQKIYLECDTAIMAGGSGLWVDGVLHGFDPLPRGDDTLRKELENKPIAELQESLKRLDPDYYTVVDLSNPQRLIRAIEVCINSGKPYSAQRLGLARERDFEVIRLALELPRAELYERINRRVDAMMAEGLLSEVSELLPYRDLVPLQTVGYSELFDHLTGQRTLDQAVELIKRNSRRYAKRQLTWLRRDPSLRWFAPDQLPQMIEMIDEYN